MQTYKQVSGDAMTTVLTLNDSAKMNRQKILTSRVCYPSQNQKRSNSTSKPSEVASHLLLPQRTPSRCNFLINLKTKIE